jgi:hypothetical protein
MSLDHRLRLAVAASVAAVALAASNASAQFPAGFITGFEPPGPTEPVGYATGLLTGQDGWDFSDRMPQVMTAEQLSNELTLAGLNPAQPVHSGNQALLVSKVTTDAEVNPPGGYFVRDTFSGLESENNVIADFWVRPLTSGLGADPSGSPAGNGKLIGERQGNIFIGVMDSSEARATAVRFGVDTTGSNPYENVTERHIDYGSAVSNPWVKSGLLWTADHWYNIRFDMDFTAKTYDFYVDGVQVNADPIRFYNEAATAAVKFFISRGTNQAGAIVDDIMVVAKDDFPTTPGDFDGSGLVDGNDFLLWQQDMTVGSLDDWKANFGASAVAAVGAIPEPASGALALAAILGLCGLRRKAGSRG